MILNLHRCLTNNIGDIESAPAKHISIFSKVKTAEIFGWKNEGNTTAEYRESWINEFREASGFIIGGGGLLGIDFFLPALNYIFENSAKRPLVLWGAGHNNWKIADWRKLKQELDLNGLPFDLIGIRDYGHEYRWVPCASCLSPSLNDPAPAIHEHVVYLHAANKRNGLTDRLLPAELPRLHNDSELSEVIAFLSSGQTILTDSYHGAYWGTLLGRKVIAFPSSSKFYDLKHPVPLCSPEDWQRFERMAVRYPEALGECRAANEAFAVDAASVLRI